MPPPQRQGRPATRGALIIVALFGLAAFIFFLDDIVQARQDRYVVVGVFDEASRLRPGSEVRIAGHGVGRVTRIQLLPETARYGNYAVDLELPRELQSLVRRDSELRYLEPVIGGPPAVDIRPGTLGHPVLLERDTLIAQPPLDYFSLLDQVVQARASLDSLLVEALPVTTTAGGARAGFERVAAGLGRAREEVEILQRDLEEGPLTEFLRDSMRVETLAGLRTTAAEITALFRVRAGRLTDPELRIAMRGLAARTERLGEQIAAVEALMQAHPLGLPARLQYDPAIRDAIAEIGRQVDSLIAETLRSPWRYWF